MPICELQNFGYFKPVIEASYLEHLLIFFFLDYGLTNIPYDHSFFLGNFVLWYYDNKTIVAEVNDVFIYSYTRDILICINKCQKSFCNDLESRLFASDIF